MGLQYLLLLMEEIRLTSWYGKFKYLIFYRVSYMLGAGFLPSTVVLVKPLDDFSESWDNELKYLARWWFQIFFIFTPIWGRFPFWLIFFTGVETTNQLGICSQKIAWDVLPLKPSTWNLFLLIHETSSLEGQETSQNRVSLQVMLFWRFKNTLLTYSWWFQWRFFDFSPLILGEMIQHVTNYNHIFQFG